MKLFSILCAIAILAAACSKDEAKQVKDEVSGVIDNATGTQAIRTMKNMEKKLDAIQNKTQQDLEDVMK